MPSRGSSLPLRCAAAGAAPDSRGASFRAPAMLSFPRQECPRFMDFLPLGIGILGQVHQFAEVFGCLLAVACAIGSASGSPVRAEAVGRLPERGLILGQG